MTYANDMPSTERVARTDAGLASELRLSVMRLRRRLAGERSPDNRLSIGTMAVLGCLNRYGESTIGELARFERVQPPSMTRTVNSLEESGFVERRPHETDGRQVVVALTDQGRDTLRVDRARRAAWLAPRLRNLPPDERAPLRTPPPILPPLSRQNR